MGTSLRVSPDTRRNLLVAWEYLQVRCQIASRQPGPPTRRQRRGSTPWDRPRPPRGCPGVNQCSQIIQPTPVHSSHRGAAPGRAEFELSGVGGADGSEGEAVGGRSYGRHRVINKIAQKIAVIYIELIRGVPLISLLFMSQVMLQIFLPTGMPPIDRVVRAMVGPFELDNFRAPRESPRDTQTVHCRFRARSAEPDALADGAGSLDLLGQK